MGLFTVRTVICNPSYRTEQIKSYRRIHEYYRSNC